MAKSIRFTGCVVAEDAGKNKLSTKPQVRRMRLTRAKRSSRIEARERTSQTPKACKSGTFCQPRGSSRSFGVPTAAAACRMRPAWRCRRSTRRLAACRLPASDPQGSALQRPSRRSCRPRARLAFADANREIAQLANALPARATYMRSRRPDHADRDAAAARAHDSHLQPAKPCSAHLQPVELASLLRFVDIPSAFGGGKGGNTIQATTAHKPLTCAFAKRCGRGSPEVALGWPRDVHKTQILLRMAPPATRRDPRKTSWESAATRVLALRARGRS